MKWTQQTIDLLLFELLDLPFAGVQFPSNAEAAVERQAAAVPAQARRPRGAGRWVRVSTSYTAHKTCQLRVVCCAACLNTRYTSLPHPTPMSWLPGGSMVYSTLVH